MGTSNNGSILKYNEQGYLDAIYEINNLKIFIDNCKSVYEEKIISMKRCCDELPSLDINSFFDSKISNDFDYFRDMIDRLEEQINYEKYIVEAFNRGTTFEVSSFEKNLFLSMNNYYFINFDDFTASITGYLDFLKNGGTSDYSFWIDDYLTEEGITSNVIDTDYDNEVLK